MECVREKLSVELVDEWIKRKRAEDNEARERKPGNPKPRFERFECDFCVKFFRAADLLESHVKLEHTQEALECEVCGKTMTSIGALRNHRKRSCFAQKVECQVCGKMVIDINDHVKTVHEVNKDTCNKKERTTPNFTKFVIQTISVV